MSQGSIPPIDAGGSDFWVPDTLEHLDEEARHRREVAMLELGSEIVRLQDLVRHDRPNFFAYHEYRDLGVRASLTLWRDWHRGAGWATQAIINSETYDGTYQKVQLLDFFVGPKGAGIIGHRNTTVHYDSEANAWQHSSPAGWLVQKVGAVEPELKVIKFGDYHSPITKSRQSRRERASTANCLKHAAWATDLASWLGHFSQNTLIEVPKPDNPGWTK